MGSTEPEKDEWSTFMKGLFLGGFLGALAGILFAPKAGKELRDEIKGKGGEAFGEAKRIYAESRTKAKDVLDEAKRRADQLRREADLRLTEARRKVSEILAGAEEEARKVMESEKTSWEEPRQELKSQGEETPGAVIPDKAKG